MYTFDPLAGLNEAHFHLVQGGQALLWAEQTAPSNLDQMIWPRAAASAEVFWSGPLAAHDPGAVREALPRLHELAFRMQRRGVQAIPLQPMWCALRRGACNIDS